MPAMALRGFITPTTVNACGDSMSSTPTSLPMGLLTGNSVSASSAAKTQTLSWSSNSVCVRKWPRSTDSRIAWA
jgi:hypothetical protein